MSYEAFTLSEAMDMTLTIVRVSEGREREIERETATEANICCYITVLCYYGLPFRLWQ